VRDGELGDEANGRDAVASDDERGSDLRVVGPESEDYGYDGGEKVDGDGQELGVRGAVAESVYDGGHGGREAAWTVRLEALDLVCALER